MFIIILYERENSSTNGTLQMQSNKNDSIESYTNVEYHYQHQNIMILQKSSSFAESLESNVDTDDDLLEINNEKTKNAKYFTIFENPYNDIDEEMMTVENGNELKKIEELIIDRTSKDYFRCKSNTRRYTMIVPIHTKNIVSVICEL